MSAEDSQAEGRSYSPCALVVMGVCGAGKTEIGQRLAFLPTPPRLIPLQGSIAKGLGLGTRAVRPVRDRARAKLLGLAGHASAIATPFGHEGARTEWPGFRRGAV